jgi:hypothetical protein
MEFLGKEEFAIFHVLSAVIVEISPCDLKSYCLVGRYQYFGGSIACIFSGRSVRWEWLLQGGLWQGQGPKGRVSGLPHHLVSYPIR